MDASGLYYPNRFARYLFLAMEDMMGPHGLEAALEQAGLTARIGSLPPYTLERAFDFAEFAAINGALDALYETRGGRGMALRIGRAWFAHGMGSFGALSGMADPAFHALPLEQRTALALDALAAIFTHFSDQRSWVKDGETAYRFMVDPSPTAWRRAAERPVCHPLVGLLQECVRGASNGREYAVREVECRAAGGNACVFVVNKHPLG